MADTTKTINVRYNIEQGAAVSSANSLVNEMKKCNLSFNQLAKDIESVGAASKGSLSQVETTTKKVSTGVKSVSDAAKKSNSDLDKFGNTLLKKFFGIEAAFKAIRSAISYVSEGFKDFSRISGDGTLDTLRKQMGQLQLEIAAALMPVLKQFSAWWETNKKSIINWGITVAEVVKGLIKYIKASLTVIKNEIEIVMGVSIGIWTKGLSTLMEGLNWLVQRAPMVSKEFKQSFQESSNFLKEYNKAIWDGVKTDAQEGVKGLKEAGSGIKDIYNAIKTGTEGGQKTSGLTYITPEQQKANEEAQKNAIAAFEKYETIAHKVMDVTDKTASSNDELSSSIYDITKKYSDLEAEVNKIDVAYSKEAASLKEMLAASKALEIQKVENSYVYGLEIEQLNYWYSEQKATYGESLKMIDEYYNKLEQLTIAKGESPLSVVNDRQSAVNERMRTLKGNVTTAKTYQSSSPFSDNSAGLQGALAVESEKMLAMYDELRDSGKFTADELSAYRLYITQYTADQEIAIEQAAMDKKLSIWQSAVGYATEIGNMIVSIGQNVNQSRINQIEQEKDAAYKALDQQYKTESKYVKNKEKLDSKYAEAKDKIQTEMEAKEREYKNKQKNWSIANALIAGAEASMNAWASAMKMGFPAGIIIGAIMQALIAASTIAQVAVISSQKFAKGGIIQGPATGDQVSVQANGGEMMINTDQQARLWDIVSGRAGMSSTPQSVTIGGDNIVVQGNLDQNAADSIIRYKESRLTQLKADIKELSYRKQLSFGY